MSGQQIANIDLALQRLQYYYISDTQTVLYVDGYSAYEDICSPNVLLCESR